MKVKDEDMLTKERKTEISVAVNRLMKIRVIRKKRKLIGWLKNHKN